MSRQGHRQLSEGLKPYLDSTPDRIQALRAFASPGQYPATPDGTRTPIAVRCLCPYHRPHCLTGRLLATFDFRNSPHTATSCTPFTVFSHMASCGSFCLLATSHTRSLLSASGHTLDLGSIRLTVSPHTAAFEKHSRPQYPVVRGLGAERLTAQRGYITTR